MSRDDRGMNDVTDDDVVTVAARKSLVPSIAVLIVLIAACVLIELCLTLGDAGAFGIPRLRAWAYENGGFWPGLLEDWKPNYPNQPILMFVSYGFLHSGPAHLIMNMVGLYFLGRAVIERVGPWRLCLLYALALVGGAGGFGLLADSLRPMVGASGALFGLAGALLAWNYVDRFAFDKRLWPVARVVIVLVAINVVQWWAMNGQLAWEAHLGGFVSGWVVALLLDPRSQPIA